MSTMKDRYLKDLESPELLPTSFVKWIQAKPFTPRWMDCPVIDGEYAYPSISPGEMLETFYNESGADLTQEEEDAVYLHIMQTDYWVGIEADIEEEMALEFQDEVML